MRKLNNNKNGACQVMSILSVHDCLLMLQQKFNNPTFWKVQKIKVSPVDVVLCSVVCAMFFDTFALLPTYNVHLGRLKWDV